MSIKIVSGLWDVISYRKRKKISSMKVSDDDNMETRAVSDDDMAEGGLSRTFRHKYPAKEEEDAFAAEIHVEDTLPKRYFTWLPGLINNCVHSFVGGWAYALIQYMSRIMNERQHRSTMEAIRAREEDLHYLHYASTH